MALSSPDFLTVRRRVILAALADYIKRTGYAPTLRVLGRMVGIRSTSSVSWHIIHLSEAGYLITPTDSQGAMLAHTMKLTERGERAAQSPETIAAWTAVRAEEPS